MTPLSKEAAYEFAMMLQTGIPAADAVAYFIDEVHPEAAKEIGMKWVRSKEVQAAMASIQRAPWASLRPDERIKLALDKHYSEMAYFLYRNSFVELSHPTMLQKANTCRMALEAKLAGMAGQMTQLSRFWDDLVAGKISIPQPKAAS
jgi:hypothetical protein